MRGRAKLKKNATLWTALALAGVLVGGAFRFADLGRLCLWSDELASLRRSTMLDFGGHVEALSGNHPLYEVAVLRPWAGFAASDAGIRVPSAVAGTLTLAIVWALGLAFDRRTAALSVWLLALSPLHVMFSRIARPYALATLWAALGMWALLCAAKRRRVRAFAGYAVFSALLVLTNLFAAVLCAAQAAFLAWFHRRRLRRLAPWAVCGLLALAAVGPWMLTHGRSAAAWGMETPYVAHQVGPALKSLYFPFVFALGETVHPLRFSTVVPAAVGFGLCAIAGAWASRRSRAQLLLLLCLLFVLAAGIFFKAASPKHMMVALPLFAVFIAVGALALRPRWLGVAALALCLATRLVSLGNYFAGEDFHDADMATPWRAIVAAIEDGERPGDKLVIGYLSDPDVYRMFRRYYKGGLDPAWLGELGPLDEPSEWLGEERTWLLLHETDPRDRIVAWICAAAEVREAAAFQLEEHTLRGLDKGLGQVGKVRSHLYKLYLAGRRR